MRPEPRLVVTDLDGTLLTSSKTVTPATAAALADARANGFALAVASARPYRLVQSVLPTDVLALFEAVIVSNGAAVIRSRDRAVLSETTLLPADAAASIGALRREWPTAGFGWESGREFSSDEVLLKLAGRGEILRDPHPDRVLAAPAEPVHQLVMAVPGVAPRAQLARTESILGSGFTVTDSLGGVVEISPSTVSKASAAEWWAGSLGATLADVVAFGDEHNDLPLLRSAGIGVAMANAGVDVKAAASAVTLSNDEDGVAVALCRLLAGDRRFENLA